MGNFIWKEGKVVSIKLRNGSFSLIQLLKSPYIVVFNLFSADNRWTTLVETKKSPLFFTAVAKNVFSNSAVTPTNIPAENFETLPRLWIHRGMGNRKVKIWENTENEMEFITGGEGGGSLVEKSIERSGVQQLNTVIEYIDFNDSETIDKYELASIHVYPEFNERLLLCNQYGRNVNPAKDLLFDRPLPIEYKSYFEIVSGKRPLLELGY